MGKASNCPGADLALVLALLLPTLLGALPPTIARAAGATVNVVLTTVDQQNKLTAKNSVAFAADNATGVNVVTGDENTTYQPMEGFGASLTDSSVWMLSNKHNTTQRAALMTKLFDPINSIGMNMLRQPMGGSDHNAPGQTSPSAFCSYDDNGGVADPTLANFSIAHARSGAPP